MTRKLLTVDEVRGAWAIIPTPALANASDWRATNTVDLDESARIVSALIDAGIDGILSLGTLGECATLTRDEKKAFMGTIVKAADGRVPVFAGSSSLSTRETISQMEDARAAGCDGTMVGPPMWNKPDTPTAVQFFKDITEAVPELAICVYGNPYVFKFDFPPQFWAGVSKFPQVVCGKVASAATLLRDVKASGGNIRMMPIDADYYSAARLDPEAALAFWSSSASCGPAPAVALRDLVAKAKETGDWREAKALHDKIGSAILPTIAYGDMAAFETHNVALEKGRMQEAGWLNPGPHRPPYHVVPDRIKEFGITAGRAWADLQKGYSK